MNLVSYDFYGDDPWPELEPHRLEGSVENVRIEHPSLTGPLQAVMTIRFSQFDSGTHQALRKLSSGVGGILDRPEATVILYYDPED